MSARYEFWLLDDSGKRICLIDKYWYFSYSRSLIGLATIEIGIPYKEWKKKVTPIFRPDWRLDVWRSPGEGYPMRREQIFLLRMPRVYTRETDNVMVIQLYGRDPTDLLNRRWVIQPAGYQETSKYEPVDDMMKAIVREQMLYLYCLDADAIVDNNRAWPEGEFSVAPNTSVGPTVQRNFPDTLVKDVLKDLRDTSKELHELNPLLYRRIYYDIVPYEIKESLAYILEEEAPNPPILAEDGEPLWDEGSNSNLYAIGFRFITIPDLYGKDRTTGVVFSPENNNLKSPFWSENHAEEVNTVIVKGYGRGDSRPWQEVSNSQNAKASRWNRCETVVDASSEADPDLLQDYGYAELEERKPDEEITAILLSTPGSKNTPRSLYGIDWDLGDLIPVEYAGKRFNVEVIIVYVSVDERGVETITGRNTLNAEGS